MLAELEADIRKQEADLEASQYTLQLSQQARSRTGPTGRQLPDRRSRRWNAGLCQRIGSRRIIGRD